MSEPFSYWEPGDPLPKPTRSHEQAIADLEGFGYTIIEDALDAERVANVRDRLVAQAKAEIEAGIAKNEPVTFAVRKTIEGAVIEMIRAGEKKGLWKFKPPPINAAAKAPESFQVSGPTKPAVERPPIIPPTTLPKHAAV